MVETLNRLQRLLSELVPGQRKKDLSLLQAKAVLATVRLRDIAARARRCMAAEELAELVSVDRKLKKIKAELKAAVAVRGSTLMEIHGIGPAGAATRRQSSDHSALMGGRRGRGHLPTPSPTSLLGGAGAIARGDG